jgi:hypothetical protein
MSATAKVIELKGDSRKPESAEHIIIFPGGSISVCRTSNNEYWAHIEVNKDEVLIDEAVRESAVGEIVDSRMDFPGGHVYDLPEIKGAMHIAVRIRTRGNGCQVQKGTNGTTNKSVKRQRNVVKPALVQNLETPHDIEPDGKLLKRLRSKAKTSIIKKGSPTKDRT